MLKKDRFVLDTSSLIHLVKVRLTWRGWGELNNGDYYRIWRMSIEVRNVDAQGRVALPSGWRKLMLKKSKEVVITVQGDELVIKPMNKCSLTQYFDAFEIDISPTIFRDYKNLKRICLGRRTDEI